MENIFTSCSKIVKDTGSLWIIIDTFKKDGKIKILPFDLAKRIQKKWNLQDIIIWNKDKTLPWSNKGRLRNIFEYILFFTKANGSDFKYYIDRIKIISDLKKWWVKYPERYNPKGKTPHRIWDVSQPDGDIWKIPIPSQGTWGNGWVRHACPFPPKLVEQILLLTTDEGDVVFDPFAGSGSVLAQARVMKRKSIGFDINEDFRQMYQERVFPAVKEMWKARKKELEKREKNQLILEDTILKLRKLKYPKEMIKGSVKTGLSKDLLSDLNSILLLDNKSNEPQFYLVYNNATPDSRELSELWTIIKELPEWIYGFNSYPKIITIKEVVQKKEEYEIPSDLYSYTKGNTNYCKTSISFDEWIQQSKRKSWKENYLDFIPPILSNIKVKERVKELKQEKLI